MNSFWIRTKLADLLVPVTRSIKVQPLDDYSLLGIRLDGGGPFLRETKPGSAISARTLNKVATGDFIYSRLFAWRGAFGVIGEELDGCLVSNEFPTFTPNSDKVDVNFLWHWFRLAETLKKVEADCTGSTPLTRNRYKENFFLTLEIPLPPLPEQRRILAKIEGLAGKIGEARSLCRKAVEEAEALVVSLHVNLAGNRLRELREIVILDEDTVPVNPAEEYPQVGIKSFGTGLFTKPPTKGTDTTYKAFNRLYAGALVLSQVKGWEGAIAVVDDGLAGWFVSPEYRTFRCIDAEVSPKYLSALVRTEWFWTRLQTATRGVGARRERTRPEQFLSIKIPMPDLDQQESAVAVFKRLNPLNKIQAEITAELDALLPAILDRAFNGGL